MGKKKNDPRGKEQILDSSNLDSDGWVRSRWELWMCNDHQDRMKIDSSNLFRGVSGREFMSNDWRSKSLGYV